MGVTLTTPRPTHGSLNWDSIIESDLSALAAAANYYNNTPTAGDLNSITRSGYYFVANGTNTPAASASTFLVLAMVGSDGTNQSQLAHQFASSGSGNLWMRNFRGGAWQAWSPVYSDSGWVTASTGIVAATGWTLNSAKYRSNNGVVSLYLNLTRTGAALTGSTAGLIAATAAAVLPVGLIPAQPNGLVSATGSQSTVAASGFVASGTGNVTITNVTPGQSIAATSGVLELVGTYLL